MLTARMERVEQQITELSARPDDAALRAAAELLRATGELNKAQSSPSPAPRDRHL